MERHGGSIARVLQRVDLPFAILDQPDLIVPLQAQFRLLERAARETGDEHFGARLGQVVKGKDLSAFGAWVCSAPTLQAAIERSHAGLNVMLQTSTNLTFTRLGDTIRWSIEFVEPEAEGRHHNEFLGVGYMIDMIRVFAGPRWTPRVIMTALPRGSPRSELELIFGTNIMHGHAIPAIEFEAALLGCKPFAATAPSSVHAGAEPPVPVQGDTLATISAVVELALHEGYPRIDWVAAKIGTTRRSLQRRLSEHGTTFNTIAEGALLRQAQSLLSQQELPVTDIALRLGYSDSAHFTRAFRRWTGLSPSTFRRSVKQSAN
jgi:AraC-like DNA-binding protein